MQEGIDHELLQRWSENGFLHLQRIIGGGAIDRINRLVDEIWLSKPSRITVDDVEEGVRCRMSDLSDDQRAHRIKINDLYLQSDEVRSLLLYPPLLEVVQTLLGEQGVLCNSLNLEKGSGQEYHADSLFMTPSTKGKLVAAWVALEDVQAGAGPLRLYPGSHRIPPFVFSDGGFHAQPGELTAWAAYMQHEIDTRALEPVAIFAAAGDVVLWHADLVHGAEPITQPSLTRRSMVGHYFGRSDSLRRGYSLRREPEGYWYARRAQPTGVGARISSAIERRMERVRAAWRARTSGR
ncbi:MAG: hypothetical protein QOK37_2847 [Thermoanaerobaculia bacterium]|jgi:hypothetical protein|nr:hypothetical protein [Thermoanaerobaculia bacterium]